MHLPVCLDHSQAVTDRVRDDGSGETDDGLTLRWDGCKVQDGGRETLEPNETHQEPLEQVVSLGQMSLKEVVCLEGSRGQSDREYQITHTIKTHSEPRVYI